MSGQRTYVLVVVGHLDPHWAGVLGADLVHRADGCTAVRAVVRDQAELHGLLSTVRDLGAELVSVLPADPPPPTEQVERTARGRA